jgi:hypothetical protein
VDPEPLDDDAGEHQNHPGQDDEMAKVRAENSRGTRDQVGDKPQYDEHRPNLREQGQRGQLTDKTGAPCAVADPAGGAHSTSLLKQLLLTKGREHGGLAGVALHRFGLSDVAWLLVLQAASAVNADEVGEQANGRENRNDEKQKFHVLAPLGPSSADRSCQPVRDVPFNIECSVQ